MKKRVILVVFVGILSTTMSYAQKVTQSADGAIIDASGMLNTTTTRKATGTDGTSYTSGSNTDGNIGSAVSNEKVYYKFEVYKSDNSTGSDWLSAVNLCKDLTVDGGGWRLPTQRELMLIWVLKPELAKITGFISFNAYSYWNSTERDGYQGWYVNFNNGYTIENQKYNSYRVRCVRDL